MVMLRYGDVALYPEQAQSEALLVFISDVHVLSRSHVVGISPRSDTL
jgi:hypothetical protein